MSLVDSKPILASGTVWAGAAVVMGSIANVLGYHLTDTDISAIVNDVSTVVTAASGLLAIYFRIKATKTLTLTGVPKK